MAQPARSTKNPLTINSLWEKTSAELPLEWSKLAAIVELAVFAKDGIEIQNLLREKPNITLPTEQILEVEIHGETDAQRRNREVRNQEKKVDWVNRWRKARDRGVYVLRRNQNTRGSQNRGPQNYTSQKQCYKCGKPLSPNHL